MAKISLSSILSGFLSASKLTENFQKIATEFQSKVLYRDNPTGEPNQMENDIDMNSNSILNVDDINATTMTLSGIPLVPNGVLSTDADQITFTPTVDILSTNVQAAIEEVTDNYIRGPITELGQTLIIAETADDVYTAAQVGTYTSVNWSIVGDTDYTLTSPQSRHGRIVLTDPLVTLTQTRNLIVPSSVDDLTVRKIYWIKNDTKQSIVVKTSTGSGVTISPNTAHVVYCDGSNVTYLLTGHGLVVSSKADALALPITEGRLVFITSDDGGQFVMRTGAAPGTYVDDGGDYCGTVIVPTGGDGSSCWRRVLDGYVTPQMFGAVGDGTASALDTPAIQAAIDSGYPVVIPSGTYNIIPATAVADEASASVLAAFILRSDLDIRGIGKPVLRLADNQSTVASPQHLRMFFSNSVLSNISLRGVVLDMNGANNKISPLAPESYNLYTQFHFGFSGTPLGVAAAGTDILIEDCSFINNAGVTCICMAQSNTNSITLGKRWTIKNCLFNNNGLDSNDHSSIFGWADDVILDGNVFSSDNKATGGTSLYPRVAHEIHGANHRFVNNEVINYFQGLWVGPNRTSAVKDSIIANNSFKVTASGIDFYRKIADHQPVGKTIITGNTFDFDDTVVTPTYKTAVQIAAEYVIEDVLISNNVARCTSTAHPSAFFNISSQSVASQKHTNIVVKSNYVEGMTKGCLIVTNATNGLGYISIEDNEFINLIPAVTIVTTAIGIHRYNTAGTLDVDHLVINENTFKDNRTVAEFDYGVYISGDVAELSMSPQVYSGLTTANYSEVGSPTITTRSGYHYDVAFTPTISIGSAITVSDGVVSAYYSLEDSLVTLNISYTIGAADTIPGGNITISGLPFTAKHASTYYQGMWRIRDNSGGSNNYFGGATLPGGTSTVTFHVDGGTVATNASPLAIAATDIINMQIQYVK